jgi:hypothetical protein
MNCKSIRDSFSGYLDGAITGREMQAVAAHLEGCAGCAADFATMRGMQRVLAAVGPVKAPADLGLKLRVAISHENARRNARPWEGFAVKWDNIFRPFLLQASAGLASAVVLLGTLAMLAGVVAAPQTVMANDEPLGALTEPHYLYSATRLQPIDTGSDATIVIRADVNEEGRVYNYTFLSGPADPRVQAQVRDQLMVEVYEPARAFGEPVRSQVLITFSGVSVTAHG